MLFEILVDYIFLRMQRAIALYKPCGYTPLQIIEEFKKINPEYEQITLGYAGRLDPQADGVLLILIGDENKKRKSYEQLNKAYTFEILFGIETDTYDIMGKITNMKINYSEISPTFLTSLANQYLGTWSQSYPPYSSPRVNSKPLFYWARKNAIHTIKIPEKKVEVKNISLLNIAHINSQNLLQTIKNRINIVTGDFRQQEIITNWEENIKKLQYDLTVARFEVTCSSGLYVRALVQDLGTKLQIPTLAYSITRTAVGPYNIKKATHIMDTS